MKSHAGEVGTMDYSFYKRFKIEKEGRLAIVTLNRPEARNAIDHQTHVELLRLFVDLAEDAETFAILLTGAGDTFTVGGDVKGMKDRPAGDVVLDENAVLDPGPARRIVHNLLDCEKPIVCAINGHAIGLGATLALLCDITVASETAKIADPHVKIGLVAGDGGAAIWPLLVGPNRAKEYLMRGMALTGAEAERVGLVNYAVPADQVYAKAHEIARELADGATWAIRWTKLSVNKWLKDQVNLILDTSMALEIATFGTEDHKEAVKAFIEKRKPVFTGR
jgi:enoyl-CoA hydratase